jgi:hypothetical protein
LRAGATRRTVDPRDTRAVKAVAIAVALVAPVATARADDGRLLDDSALAVSKGGPLVVDAGFITGMPAGLPSGLFAGIGAGIERTCTCWLSYGARLSWDEISASSEVFTVTDQELRARATVALRRDVGRAVLALRLGAGTDVVVEDRVRNGGMRAGLTGSALETHELAALPAGDVAAVVGLKIAGAWRFVASGGPTADILNGAFHGGWTAELGIGWQPR